MICLAILIAWALVACASTTQTTTIEQSWRAPRADQLHQVVALFPARDGVVRRNVEDRLAWRLSQRGVHAVPAYTVLRPDDLRDREHVVAALRRAGYDGVVAMRMIDTRHGLAYDPGFDLYWGRAWGHVVPEAVMRMQIDVYALRGDQLVWSARSRSVDPPSMDVAVDDVAKVVSRELAAEQVVTARR